MADEDLTTIFTAGDLHDSGAPGELAIHRDGRLFWNGNPVVTERPLSLTFWQKFGAVLTVASAVTVAVVNVASFLDWKLPGLSRIGEAHARRRLGDTTALTIS